MPVPEGIVNLIGYQLLGENKLDEAIVVFKSNVDEHPGSANVHDSLGEAYEKKGMMDLARDAYQKAMAAAEKMGDPNAGAFKQNYERLAGKSTPLP